jgi:hypothetical protein
MIFLPPDKESVAEFYLQKKKGGSRMNARSKSKKERERGRENQTIRLLEWLVKFDSIGFFFPSRRKRTRQQGKEGKREKM